MDPFGNESEDLNNFQAQSYDNSFYENDGTTSEGGAAPVADYAPPTSSFSEPMSAAPISTQAAAPVIEENNALSKFLHEYEQQVAQKAVEQEKVAVESKQKAQADMKKFETERARLKESKHKANRTQEQATLEKLAHDLESENPWERVVSLVDMEAGRKAKLASIANKKDKNQQEPPKAKKEEEKEDLSRMRQLFVQLKAEPLDKSRAKSIASH